MNSLRPSQVYVTDDYIGDISFGVLLCLTFERKGVYNDILSELDIPFDTLTERLSISSEINVLVLYKLLTCSQKYYNHITSLTMIDSLILPLLKRIYNITKSGTNLNDERILKAYLDDDISYF